MPSAHSKYSASGFEAATLCPGKRPMESGKPDKSSKYADEGTAAHSVLELALLHNTPPAAEIGRKLMVGKDLVEVTAEMATAVQTAIDNIREIVGDGMLLTEQRVNYSAYLGVDTDEAWGTSDIVAMRSSELQVHDYKHGMGVEVDADDNTQLKLYALGALQDMRAMGEEPTSVRLVIHQPRIKKAPSEWATSVEDLERWGHVEARRAVDEQVGAEHMRDKLTPGEWETIYLRPNEKSCKFCRAKSTCPALRDMATETVMHTRMATVEEFEAATVPSADHIKPATDDWLGAVMSKAKLIEGWLTAVATELERRLLAGGTVPGWKLVLGKKGNRAWGDAVEVEGVLKAMRLKTEEMYDLKLISPTSAEKLTAGEQPVIGPRQWTKVKALITQAAAKPSVAPESDKRPAMEIAPVTDEFAVVATANEESFA